MVESRQTRQRGVLEGELKSFKTFFSAEDLLERVSKKDKKIGIATIYRFLKRVRDEGVIFSYSCAGKTIYSNNSKSHCHFECTESGKIFHFEIENLDFLKDKIPGHISSFQLEVKGVCSEHCAGDSNCLHK
jgi:Fur family ferric uptake transcriptional regulator